MQGRTQGFAPTVPGIMGKIFLVTFLMAFVGEIKWLCGMGCFDVSLHDLSLADEKRSRP
jgi:hypothetical protein